MNLLIVIFHILKKVLKKRIAMCGCGSLHSFVRSFVCMMSFIGLLTLCLNGEMCLFHFFNSPSKSVWCE